MEKVRYDKRYTSYLVLSLLKKGKQANALPSRKQKLIHLESTMVSALEDHNAIATKMPSFLRFLRV